MSSIRVLRIWLPILLACGALLLFALPKQQARLASPGACSCEKSPDPFDQPRAYAFGAHAGRCIDSCTFRAPALLAESGSRIEVANLFHAGRFWKASLPMDSVQSVDVLFQRFTETFHHVSLRFHFAKERPVRLRSQTPGAAEEAAPVLVDSLVVSPEGVPPAGEKYSLVDALLGRYVVTYRLSSFDDYREVSERLNYPLRAYPLKLEASEGRELFRLAIDRALHENFESVYQLIFNNCATLSLDLALSAKELRSPGRALWEVMDPLRGIPLERSLGTRRSFEWWHLIEPSQARAERAEDLSVLRPWVGRQPFEKIGRRDFWSQPALQARLDQALGPEDSAALKTFIKTGPSSLVEEKEGFLFTNVCMAHNCADERFEIAVDLEKDRIYVCRASDRGRKKGSVTWSSSQGRRLDVKGDCRRGEIPKPLVAP